VIHNRAAGPVDDEPLGLLFAVNFYARAGPHIDVYIFEVSKIGDFDWDRQVGTCDGDLDYLSLCKQRCRHSNRQEQDEQNTRRSLHSLSFAACVI